MKFYYYMESVLGKILLLANQQALIGVYLHGQKYFPNLDVTWQLNPQLEIFQNAVEQLTEYLNGARMIFNLPLAFTSGTVFQQKVWHEINRIPFGTTVSYKELSQRIGKPASVRAVAAAVGRNPISLLVPCHRVIGSDGSLTGYAGGIDRKRTLLMIEKELLV